MEGIENQEAASAGLGSWLQVLTAMHMRTADDLFGGPRGQPAHRSANCREYSVGGADHAED